MAASLGPSLSRRLSAILDGCPALAALARRRRSPARFLPAGESVLRDRIRACASAGLAAGAAGRHLAHSHPFGGYRKMSSLSPEAYAVIEGRHSDPFHYLGPHVEGDVPVVRVFLPNAETVAVVAEQGDECALDRIQETGLFAGQLAHRSSRYRLRAGFGDGRVEMEDPYRFPPVLSDFDLSLLGDGNHLTLYATPRA